MSKIRITTCSAREATSASFGCTEGVKAARTAAGRELGAQGRDEHLDRVGRRERVVAPRLVEQTLARDHDALVAHQVLEQLELALRELHWPLTSDDLVGIDVE